MLLDHRVLASQSRDKLEVSNRCLRLRYRKCLLDFPVRSILIEISGDVRLFLPCKQSAGVKYSITGWWFRFFVLSLKRLSLTLWVRGATG